jgi:ketosteroid isomerase-like protein/predicted ester cyclase
MGPLEMQVREMFDVVINQGEVERVTDYVEPTWISHTPQGDMDVAAFKEYVRAWRTGFPDIQCEVYDVIESDDERIAWRVRARGTHTGEFMGIPATKKYVDFDSMNFGRGRNNKGLEHTMLMDLGAMMAQLGIPMGPTGAADRIRTGYDAFARQDIPTVLSLFDADIVWQTPESIPVLGGRYVGVDEVTKFFMTLPTVYAEFHVVPDRFLESGDDVTVLGHHRGTIAATGATFEIPFVHCWTLRDGKATTFTEYMDSAAMASLLATVPRQEIRLDESTRTTTG